jgi:hypothetical protein
MPKRSNQFQKIVTYISEQLAPLGATVKESVELPEKGLSGVVREVDTLIEVGAGLTRVRIAVESRDRKRKDDVEWIDCLIGKYALLPVDRVLAVSNTGFSASAKRKAEVHNIEVLSPQELVSTDWPSKFQKIGMALLQSLFHLQYVEFETTPPFLGKVMLEDRIRYNDENGENEEGTVKEFIQELGPTVIAGVRKYISKNFLTIYKTLEDLSKPAVIERSVSGKGLSLLVGESCYEINKVTFRMIARNERSIAPVEHRALGENALLSSGRLGELEFVVAQVAGASEGKVFFGPADIRKRRGKKKER